MGARAADRTGRPTARRRRTSRRDAMATSTTRDTIVQLVDALDAATRPARELTSTRPTPRRTSTVPTATPRSTAYRDTDARARGQSASTSTGTTRCGSSCPTTTRRTLDDREPIDLQAGDRPPRTRPVRAPGGQRRRWSAATGAGEARALAHRRRRRRRHRHRSISPTPTLECCLVWSRRGARSASPEMGTSSGTHGGPAHTRTGRGRDRRSPGRPNRWPRRSATRRVEAADWAPTIAALLDLDLPHATGRPLVA